MKAISLRTQLGLVGAGYAGVLVVATGLVFARYMQYALHPQDAAAYGTMWGFGDWLLALFIGFMLLVPTFVLALLVRQQESVYTRYANVMLGLSLTLPISVGLMAIPAVGQGNTMLGEISMYRLLCSPVVIIALIFSRLLAGFGRAKRLTLYALLIEAGTLGVVVALMVI